jgi:hypothetical protein
MQSKIFHQLNFDEHRIFRGYSGNAGNTVGRSDGRGNRYKDAVLVIEDEPTMALLIGSADSRKPFGGDGDCL